jgi:glycosyltransferase involved in cell wall biosynthesis
VSQRDYLFIVPTLKTTGGNLEVLRLAHELRRNGEDVSILSLWNTSHPLPTGALRSHLLSDRLANRRDALISLLAIVARFVAARRRLVHPGTRLVFTHYATYALLLLTPHRQRWFFVQDLEWHFIRRFPFRSLLKRAILAALRRGKVLAANRFLSNSLEQVGIMVAATADIWADPAFAVADGPVRDVDVTIMLRKGAHKRADWGAMLLETLRFERPDLRLVVISPDEEFAPLAGAVTFLLRPTRDQLRQTYRRSRLFVLFSEHEGFGLPPLEAMGSGCVPLCRDAGGVRAYMEPELIENIVPLAASVQAMTRRIYALLDDEAEWRRLSNIGRSVFARGLERAATRQQRLAACGFTDESVASCQ